MLISQGWFIVYLCALVVITPLLLPATKRKSLEEIGTVFGDRHTAISIWEVPKKGVVDLRERYIGGDAKESEHVEVSGQL
jgi:hypothetical protein